MQMEILSSYATQVRDVEQLEKDVILQKQDYESKITQLDERQKKLRTDEDFLVKEKTDWNAQSSQRINELEATLKQKREQVERLEKDYSTKKNDLEELQNEIEETKKAEDKKLKHLLKIAEEDRSLLDNEKTALLNNKTTLDSERKNFEDEV